MNALSIIKSQVEYLYKTNPDVHIDVSNRHTRMSLSNVPAVITAVYSNIFSVKYMEDGIERVSTFQYVDLHTRTVVIRERDELKY